MLFYILKMLQDMNFFLTSKQYFKKNDFLSIYIF